MQSPSRLWIVGNRSGHPATIEVPRPTVRTVTGPLRIVERIRSLPSLRREADVMGLTIALSLLVALSSGNDHSPHSRTDVLAIVWATTLALGLAHWFAETLSSHLVKDSSMQFTIGEMLAAQLGLGLVIAAAASIVAVIVPLEYDRLAARVIAALSVGLLVATERRAAGASVARASLWAIGALIATLAIAVVKWFIGR